MNDFGVASPRRRPAGVGRDRRGDTCARGTTDTSLVTAARAGDRRAMDELLGGSLPLVYTIVRRTLDGHADTDDVVQDIMLRAVRQLSALRRPESFRSWLTSIAVHQVSTHLHRRRAVAQRAAPLDEAIGMPDPDAEIEDVTMLQVELSAQRRQVVHAGYWLDSDDRVLLSLWLLESAGELTRTEIAQALGTSVAHTGVRIQRMRRQLDLSRELVAALDARPRCAALQAAAADWDGTPDPLWRKRLTRHTRSCDVCRRAAADILPAERLLPGLVLLPVPIGLTAALLGKTAATAPLLAASSSAALTGASTASTGAGVKAGLLGPLLQTLMAHPIAASVAAGALAAGAAVTVTTLPATAPPSHGAIATPTSARSVAAPRSVGPSPTRTRRSPAATTATPPATAGVVLPVPGRPISLESADEPGQFVTTADDLGFLKPVRAGNDAAVKRQATFTAISGLADPACFSFRARDGRYLRHASWRLRLDPDQGTPLFRADATFCVHDGAAPDSVTLEASNYPGWFVHHRGSELWVDQTDRSTAFRVESSFRFRPALAS
jgi:RNA polymerase sigma factor (sigma-70 family)